MTTYAERNRKAEKSIRSMDNRLSLGLDDRNRSRTRSCPPLKGGRNTTPLIGNKKAVALPIALPVALPCHVRGTVKLVAGRGHISTYRSLSIADAAWVLANCVIRRFRQPVESVAANGVCSFRLLQTRTWPSAPIPSATGRPQKICLSRSRSPTPRVSLSIANCTPTADVSPRC